jgi:putative ATP-dependent endonuclease of OLD family
MRDRPQPLPWAAMPMYLAQVEVRNFRCLRDLRVDLQPGLNVLVGRNNVGKTALLSAIRIALGPASARGDAVWLNEDDFHRPGPGATRASEISIVLTFRGLTDQERTVFYEIVDFDHSDLKNSAAIVRFHATWNENKRRAVIRRSGGAAGANAPEVPSQILEALPVTFLPAMRNAEEHLAPGQRSRLAQMLREIADRNGGTSRTDIERIFNQANKELEADPLIEKAHGSLQTTTRKLSGTDYTKPSIRAAGVEFDRILRTLQVQVAGAPVEGLHANGLGYNNLLYMAVVLEHLHLPVEDECQLLMVEEPEAHLHPQLTSLLAEYLSTEKPAGNVPQTIVSTHSPTLVAAVPTERVILFFTDPVTNELRSNSLVNAALLPSETRAVRRMMDVTRASMYFAKGLIFVEGICEALLFPELARRIGYDLTKEHVAVVPVCGVAFETFKKLLGPAAFGIRTAIVTDADPPVLKSTGRWQDFAPDEEAGQFVVSPRTQKLVAAFSLDDAVRVFHSRVTLEFDLTLAGAANAEHVAAAWEKCFEGEPRTLTRAMVSDAALSTRDKALAVWRGVCLASSTGSKADLAQHLAQMLSEPDGCPGFVVPEYIAAAIRHVLPSVAAPENATPIPSHADANT